MKSTTTYISWPCRLKIGAKTKKGNKIETFAFKKKNIDLKLILDPHVRILGKANDIVKAKDRILAALDSRVIKKIIKIFYLVFTNLKSI